MRKRQRHSQKRRAVRRQHKEQKRDKKWRRRQDRRAARDKERNELLRRVMPLAKRAMSLSVNGNARAVLTDVDPHEDSHEDAEDWNDPDVWTFTNDPSRVNRKPGVLCTEKGVHMRQGAFTFFDRPWSRLSPARLRELLRARWVPDEPKDAVTALGELA